MSDVIEIRPGCMTEGGGGADDFPFSEMRLFKLTRVYDVFSEAIDMDDFSERAATIEAGLALLADYAQLVRDSLAELGDTD